jgi:hypothetical protein
MSTLEDFNGFGFEEFESKAVAEGERKDSKLEQISLEDLLNEGLSYRSRGASDDIPINLAASSSELSNEDFDAFMKVGGTADSTSITGSGGNVKCGPVKSTAIENFYFNFENERRMVRYMLISQL